MRMDEGSAHVTPQWVTSLWTQTPRKNSFSRQKSQRCKAVGNYRILGLMILGIDHDFPIKMTALSLFCLASEQ